jgi:tryptophanyl-tRNA synthetase
VVYAFHGIYSKAEQAGIRGECESGKRGCVDCKMELAGRMNSALRAIRDKRSDLDAKPELIKEILHSGAIKARKIARATLDEARSVMKLGTGRAS